MPRSTGFSVRTDTTRLVALIRNMPARSIVVVDETTNSIRDLAENLAPRDTGSLAASLYVNNGTDSDYSQHAAAARSRNRQAVIVPEVRPEFVLSPFGNSQDAYLVVAGAAVGHGIFQELGTVHMGAQAFMTPAVEAYRDQFQQAMSHVADT